VSKETKEQEYAGNANQVTIPVEGERDQAKDPPEAPEPTAMGNEQVSILKHDMYYKDGDKKDMISIKLQVKNVSDITLGSARFEAELYDIGGNTLDTIEKKTIDFKPGITRSLHMDYSGTQSDKVRSYCVKVAGIAFPPEPEVTGNDKIKILKHGLYSGLEDVRGGSFSGINMAIRNVSEKTMATLIFKAEFYDIEGNMLDTVQHKEFELRPNTGRSITIKMDKKESSKLKSYIVNIARMTTVDLEKIQLRRHEIKTVENGEEVTGIVKNISETKTDTALVATFLDANKENIGIRVVILRDIEPNTTREFHCKFKPIQGDQVRSYTLDIGELVD
jgi:hypothetical protein